MLGLLISRPAFPSVEDHEHPVERMFFFSFDTLRASRRHALGGCREELLKEASLCGDWQHAASLLEEMLACCPVEFPSFAASRKVN